MLRKLLKGYAKQVGLPYILSLPCRRFTRLLYPPTFIVGPPRTGSTLTMQLIAQALPVCFFTNLTSYSYKMAGAPLPYVSALVGHYFGGDSRIDDYRSTEGRMEGLSSPTEGTSIWEFYFGTRRAPVKSGELSKEQQRMLFQAVSSVEGVYGLPFIQKSINLTLRVRALSEIFPSALFIQMKRNQIDVVQSLYRVRTKSAKGEYFGPKPTKHCRDRGDAKLIEETCEQVYLIEKSLACDWEALGKNRFMSVCYRDMCAKPIEQIKHIADFLSDNGVPVKPEKKVPRRFQRSHGRKVSEDVFSRIVARLEELYKRDEGAPHLDNN